MGERKKIRTVGSWIALFLRVIAGYVVAAILASFVTVVCFLLLIELFEGGGADSFDEFGIFWGFGLLYTSVTAWPGYLLTIFLALRGILRFGPLRFALAGFLTSIQATVVFDVFLGAGSDSFLTEPPMMLSIFLGGASAGYVYGLWHPKLHRI